MRILRYDDGTGSPRFAKDLGNGMIQPLTGELFGRLQADGESRKLGPLLAPFQPTNIFCVGLNYRQHAQESNAAVPDRPVVFMKPTSSVVGPADPIVLPRVCDPTEVDYEAELAVVIGKTAKNVSVQNARDYVFGYTVANDISARVWQHQLCGGQWIRGKGFDTFCPLGPVIVTADELPDPQALRMRTTLNGSVMQDQTTRDMIFSVAELVSFLSQDTTLLPGTLILTGTPEGVGAVRKPPVWLKAGDEVAVEISGIGRICNPVVRA